MKTSTTSLILLFMMLAAAGLAIPLRPTRNLAAEQARFDLDSVLPVSFPNWRSDPNKYIQVVNPIEKANVERIYSQTLSRTYVGPSGYRVMLSLAYGRDQRSGIAMSVHFPEVCYPAQGFDVTSNRIGKVSTVHGAIPVRLLETKLGNTRYEPVTYWTTIGQYVTLGGVDRRLIELRYGLNGEIPDGLLFRVSSLDTDSVRAFALQEKFIADLVQSLSSEQRIRLAGSGSK